MSLMAGMQAVVAGSGGAPPLVAMALQLDGATVYGEITDFFTAGEVTAAAVGDFSAFAWANCAGTPDFGVMTLCAAAIGGPSPTFGLVHWQMFQDIGNGKSIAVRRGGTARRVLLGGVAQRTPPLVDGYSVQAGTGTAQAYKDGAPSTTSVSADTQPVTGLVAALWVGRRGSAYSVGKISAYALCRVVLSDTQHAACAALIDARDVEGLRDYLLGIDPTGAGLWWPTDQTVVGDGIIDLCGNYGNMQLINAIQADIVEMT